jgi:hypothetical protein
MGGAEYGKDAFASRAVVYAKLTVVIESQCTDSSHLYLCLKFFLVELGAVALDCRHLLRLLPGTGNGGKLIGGLVLAGPTV